MSSVLDRSALEQSPLADLHLLANELGVDGFRRLRKPDLIDALIAHQAGGEPEADTAVEVEEEEEERKPRRSRRGGRGRSRREGEESPAPEAAPEPAADAERGVEGTVELLANGSGFLRLAPPEATDEDVYISAAQVKRCELVSGDRISGPMRAARRSERYPSLVR